MKKQVMIIAALMAICMTGCDTAVMSGSDSSSIPLDDDETPIV